MALRLAQDSHRHGAVRSGPVPELSERVIAPAVHRPRRSEGAGMQAASADRGEGEPTAHGDGNRAGSGRTIAELAGEVRSPAVRRSVGGETAGMNAPGAHRREGEPPADSQWDQAGRGGPVAELA